MTFENILQYSPDAVIFLMGRTTGPSTFETIFWLTVPHPCHRQKHPGAGHESGEFGRGPDSIEQQFGDFGPIQKSGKCLRYPEVSRLARVDWLAQSPL